MFLGSDWGQKKIGLAVAHDEIAIASSLRSIPNDHEVFAHLRSIVQEYDINRIVIGRSAHATQNDNVDAINKFGALCQENLGVDVDYITEIFTTREAHTNLRSAGKKNIDAIDDAEAARIILQQYIDAGNGKL